MTVVCDLDTFVPVLGLVSPDQSQATRVLICMLPLVQNVSVERPNITLSLLQPLLPIPFPPLITSQVIIMDKSEILQQDNWKRKSYNFISHISV